MCHEIVIFKSQTEGMANGFIETENGLHYEEHISVPLRIFVGVMGVGMFVIPIPFVQHTHWGLPVWQLLLVALCIVAPSLMGLLCLAIALGRCLRLRFDSQRRQMLRTSRWPLAARWAAIDYAKLVSPGILERSSEDGPFYVISLTVHGERPMHLGAFDGREEAERWRQRIAAQLHYR